jgi:hypothetical protein
MMRGSYENGTELLDAGSLSDISTAWFSEFIIGAVHETKAAPWRIDTRRARVTLVSAPNALEPEFALLNTQ